MADRRMFSKTIVNSARFLKMPASSRLLYYDLGMAADDEGVAEAYTVMQMTGASADDLSVLVSKGFVQIVLDTDLVIVITDWKKNNKIRPDRFHESIYHKLLVNDVSNVSFCQPNDNQVSTKCLPSDNQMSTEDRRGKDSIKYAQNDTAKARFDMFWNEYPKRLNKKKAYEAWKKINLTDELFYTIMEKLDAFKKLPDWTKDNGKYIPYASTWINGRRWEDEIDQPEQPKPKPFVIGDDGHAHYV